MEETTFRTGGCAVLIHIPTREILAMVDYDGGEIDGTGDGRLFAFAGTEPAKLIEFDRETGEVMYGEVPPYSVVVAGTMPSGSTRGETG